MHIGCVRIGCIYTSNQIAMGLVEITKTPLGIFLAFSATCMIALALIGFSALGDRYNDFYPDWDRIMNLLAFVLAEMIAQRLVIGVDRSFTIDECARKAVTNMNLIRRYLKEFRKIYEWKESVPEFYNIDNLRKEKLSILNSDNSAQNDEEYTLLMDSTIIHVAMENGKQLEKYLRNVIIPYTMKQNAQASQKADLTVIYDRIASCLDAVDTLNTATFNVVPVQFHNLLLIVTGLFCGIIIPMSLAPNLGILHSLIVVYVTAAVIYYTIAKAHQMDVPNPKDIKETKNPGSETYGSNYISNIIFHARTKRNQQSTTNRITTTR
jgi:hypothetical protein